MARLMRFLAVAGLYALVASFAAPLVDHYLAEHASGPGSLSSQPGATANASLASRVHRVAGVSHGVTDASASDSMPCVLPCTPLTDGRVMASAQDIASEHMPHLVAPDIRPALAPETETGLLSASLPQVTPPPRA